MSITAQPSKNRDAVRRRMELRRCGAAGVHGKRRNRSVEKRRAINDQF